MKRFLFLALLPALAFAQSVNGPAADKVAQQYIATAPSGSQAFGMNQGALFCGDGKTCTNYFKWDGTNWVIVGGVTVSTNFAVSGNTTIGDATSDTFTFWPTTLSLVKENAHTVAIATSTTTNTAGGALTVAAGTASGNATGGNLVLNAGSTTSGTAGSITIGTVGAGVTITPALTTSAGIANTGDVASTATMTTPAIRSASAGNVALTVNAAGTGTVTIAGTSTGAITMARNTNFSGYLFMHGDQQIQADSSSGNGSIAFMGFGGANKDALNVTVGAGGADLSGTGSLFHGFIDGSLTKENTKCFDLKGDCQLGLWNANGVKIAGSAAGSPMVISVVSGNNGTPDTNVGINLTAKGSGVVAVTGTGGLSFGAASGVAQTGFFKSSATTIDLGTTTAAGVTQCVLSANVTVTGAALGDSCVLGMSTDSSGDDGVYSCVITGAGTAKVKFCSTNTYDPASRNYTIYAHR